MSHRVCKFTCLTFDRMAILLLSPKELYALEFSPKVAVFDVATALTLPCHRHIFSKYLVRMSTKAHIFLLRLFFTVGPLRRRIGHHGHVVHGGLHFVDEQFRSDCRQCWRHCRNGPRTGLCASDYRSCVANLLCLKFAFVFFF